MSNYLDPDDQAILLPLVELSISRQEARVFLEQEQLDDLYKLKESIEGGCLPEEIGKVKNGMVSLDMIEMVRNPR